MLQLVLQKFDIPLQHPFRTSRYTVALQKTCIISISCGTYTGYGEATVNPYYQSTVDKIEASIKKVTHMVTDAALMHPSELWELLKKPLTHDYFSLCAIDCAFWDWFAQKNKIPLRQFWSRSELHIPKTNYTIGMDSIAVMKKKIEEFPWPIYKIKLGTDTDIEIIRALRSITDAVFRIDANCAWTATETIQNSIVLKELGVEFIEQPLKASALEAMLDVKKKSSLPIIADESCQREEDIDICQKSFDGINIKLMKCGGITPALRMIEKARKANLLVMMGCMTESSIGISSLCQLAPLLDYIDADGAMLLKNDIAKGVQFSNGAIVFSSTNGAGSQLLK